MHASIDECEQRVQSLSDRISRITGSAEQHRTTSRERAQEKGYDDSSIRRLQASVERCEQTVQQAVQQLSDRFARFEGRVDNQEVLKNTGMCVIYFSNPI